MGEEDGTVDGCAADMRGPASSGSERGRRVRGRGRRAGPARGPRARAGKTGRGIGRPVGLASMGRAGRAAWAARPSLLFFSFLFFFPSSLFEFHFDF